MQKNVTFVSISVLQGSFDFWFIKRIQMFLMKILHISMHCTALHSMQKVLLPTLKVTQCSEVHKYNAIQVLAVEYFSMHFNSLCIQFL